jgi:HD-GYP domain-containing protein (c-di-GMP phosphodiesterase class II)
MEERKNNTLLLNEILESLGTVVEYNLDDHYTHQHALRVGEGAVVVGERMELEDPVLQKLYYAGVLHDIGKISVPIEILNKKADLTKQEFKEIKSHAISGGRMVAGLPGMTELASWIRWHHEWWDGSGYPDGLKGEEIPLPVQILSILDMFDSLQTPRPDRGALSKEQAFEIMQEHKGNHFSPELVDVVLELAIEGHVDSGRDRTERFMELKKRVVDVPFEDYDKDFWYFSGINSLYHVLKLFAHVIDSKHIHTKGHSTRVSVLAKLLCERMKMSHEDILKAEIAGLLHDAGKVTIPVEILDKADSLTEEEWNIIRTHTTKTFEIIGYSETMKEIGFIAACHHERYDGKGYPLQLAANEIPYLSHVIAVADTFDAITSARAYHPERSPEYAYQIISEISGTQLHPEIVKQLLLIPPKHVQALIDMHAKPCYEIGN